MIKAWLTQCKQRVILNNEVSNFVPVKSGIPQGTVLRPLMSLLYINDIATNINSSLCLFADDCINVFSYDVLEINLLHQPLTASIILKTQHPYLGVVFPQSMSWSHHIDHLHNKATKSLKLS